MCTTYMCIYVRMYIYLFAIFRRRVSAPFRAGGPGMCMYLCLRVCAYMCMCICVCVCVCVYVYMYLCVMYVCTMYICVEVHIFICDLQMSSSLGAGGPSEE